MVGEKPSFPRLAAIASNPKGMKFLSSKMGLITGGINKTLTNLSKLFTA